MPQLYKGRVSQLIFDIIYRPTPVLSFQTETYQKNDNTKFPSRVVVKNERGERVLDTLVKADLPDINVRSERRDL